MWLGSSNNKDKLMDKQKRAIDPALTESILEQIQNEIQNKRFPSPGATLK